MNFIETLKSVDLVLATGEVPLVVGESGIGKTALARKLAKNNALTIWLKADLDVLYSRTVGRKRRPFLQCTDSKIKSKLQTYIDEEYPYYNEANIIVETKNESVDDTVEKVFNAINNYVFQNEQEMYND